jgi:hypothetical protein
MYVFIYISKKANSHDSSKMLIYLTKKGYLIHGDLTVKINDFLTLKRKRAV